MRGQVKSLCPNIKEEKTMAKKKAGRPKKKK
jgi:hypothetical protein